jgi:hypothetical protein
MHNTLPFVFKGGEKKFSLMENLVDTSIKNFCEWYCKDRDSMLENKFQRQVFLGLLKKEPDVILKIIKEDLVNKITEYEHDFKEGDFDSIDFDDLSVHVLESLKSFTFKSK